MVVSGNWHLFRILVNKTKIHHLSCDNPILLPDGARDTPCTAKYSVFCTGTLQVSAEHHYILLCVREWGPNQKPSPEHGQGTPIAL